MHSKYFKENNCLQIILAKSTVFKNQPLVLFHCVFVLDKLRLGISIYFNGVGLQFVPCENKLGPPVASLNNNVYCNWPP